MRTKLENILHQIMNYFNSQNPQDVPFLCMKHIHPYLRQDWSRIKEANLDLLFVELFIAVGTGNDMSLSMSML